MVITTISVLRSSSEQCIACWIYSTCNRKAFIFKLESLLGAHREIIVTPGPDVPCHVRAVTGNKMVDRIMMPTQPNATLTTLVISHHQRPGQARDSIRIKIGIPNPIELRHERRKREKKTKSFVFPLTITARMRRNREQKRSLRRTIAWRSLHTRDAVQQSSTSPKATTTRYAEEVSLCYELPLGMCMCLEEHTQITKSQNYKTYPGRY